MTICFIPLGVNGLMPSFNRQTMSFLFLTQNEAILLDAGTGAARLLEKHIASILEPYDCLNIILSHYHIDHIVGLSFLPRTWQRGCIRIYAPGKPFVNATPEHALTQFLHPPLFPFTLQHFPAQVEIIQINQNELKIGNFTIQVRGQQHSGGSIGIRIDDVLAYCTDTIVDEYTHTFVKDVDFLLHDVWLTDTEAQTDNVVHSSHSYVSGVAQIASKAKVGRLMPVHHHPKRSFLDLQNVVEDIQEKATIEVIMPEEGMHYQLD